MSNARGSFGETYVTALLEKQGFHILKRNYARRGGEIDIIAADEQYILFVEVKTRSSDFEVSPAEAVTPAKQRRIVSTALRYMQENPTELQPRFDVACVLLHPKTQEVKTLDYIENAFSGGGYA